MLRLVRTKTLKRREAELKALREGDVEMTTAIQTLRREKMQLVAMREQEQLGRGPSQTRVGSRKFDALTLQAECRRIVTSFTILPVLDGPIVEWHFYANRQITDAECNGLEGVLGFTMDRS